jgi:hypothetical protein
MAGTAIYKYVRKPALLGTPRPSGAAGINGRVEAANGTGSIAELPPSGWR